jgi:hypothetical protein
MASQTATIVAKKGGILGTLVAGRKNIPIFPGEETAFTTR